jgi:hypothetical protein
MKVSRSPLRALRIRFRLGVRPSTSANKPRKSEPALRLLLVDDDPVVLEALHLKLEADGFDRSLV